MTGRDLCSAAFDVEQMIGHTKPVALPMKQHGANTAAESWEERTRRRRHVRACRWSGIVGVARSSRRNAS